jgi:hypothetical protein
LLSGFNGKLLAISQPLSESLQLTVVELLEGKMFPQKPSNEFEIRGMQRY